MIKKITKADYEELYVYLSAHFLTQIKTCSHAYLYGYSVYLVRLSDEGDSVIVDDLDIKQRMSFIKDFALFALHELLELYKPKENCLLFKSGERYFIVGIKDDKMFARLVEEKDLK